MLYQIVIVIIAVVLSIVLIRKNINIGIVMLINCLFVAISTKMSVFGIWKTLYMGVFSESTISTIIVMILIMMIENIMRSTGMIKQMVDSLREIVPNRKLSIILLPAALGLLPSPGGARFSCPMIEEVAGQNLTNEQKAFFNYWYRHIWLDGFILYPGMILVSELTGISAITIFACLLPFMLIHVLAGVYFMRGIHFQEESCIVKKRGQSARSFAASVFPIVLIIGLYMFFLQFTRYALQIAGIITVIMLIVYKKYKPDNIIKLIRESVNFKYILIIAGVMVFNEFLNYSGATMMLSEAITEKSFPVELLFIVLPFIGGAISGISLSFIALSFPILIPLGLNDNIWNVVITLVSGFSGVMLTPIHLCGVMSADYFRVGINQIMKKVAVTEVIMIFSVVLLILFIKL